MAMEAALTTTKTMPFNVAEKKGTLHLVMLGLWLAIILALAPGLWRTFGELTTVLARVFFVPFTASLFIFWFFGVYHLVFLIFAYTHKPNSGFKSTPLGKDVPRPKTAILYATFNDFNREAALTCLAQDYGDFHMFLVDVSTDPRFREQTDAFCKDFPSQVTMVRLQPRQGFKARSLNDTLKTTVGEEYQFFAVCDADNRLPVNFLSLTIPYFLIDPRIAFVQANHRLSGHSEEKFAADFEVAVNASWYLHQRPRDTYGLVMCMGHGVIVRREAWVKVGGYPEIVQEDTAFTMRLRQYGYYGCFAPEVVAFEGFPEDFRRWQRRQFRLVQADAEILLTQVPGFLKNRKISLVEKIDIVTRSLRLPSQSLALPFLALLVLIPLAEGDSLFRMFSSDVISGGLLMPFFDGRFGAMLSPAFYTVTLATAAAPLVPFLVYQWKRPLGFLALSLRGLMLHLSLISAAFVSLVAFLLRGSAFFTVTGAAGTTTVETRHQSRLSVFLSRINVGSPLVTGLNIAGAVILGYVGMMVGDAPVLLGIALVLLLTPAILRFGWNSRGMSGLIYLPPLVIVIGLVAGLSGILGSQSQFLALAILSILLF
ncbi:MAG: glycosyltransferase family 2 protein [Chloroflexi bacterium]|nr:glycosyltransferase family 2 protein [Chloroflexota bacterium]